jgi:hypothetical protein
MAAASWGRDCGGEIGGRLPSGIWGRGASETALSGVEEALQRGRTELGLISLRGIMQKVSDGIWYSKSYVWQD